MTGVHQVTGVSFRSCVATHRRFAAAISKLAVRDGDKPCPEMIGVLYGAKALHCAKKHSLCDLARLRHATASRSTEAVHVVDEELNDRVHGGLVATQGASHQAWLIDG